MKIYRTKLRCLGLTDAEGQQAAPDIVEGFRERPWHSNVVCSWDGESLWLEAESDFDAEGKALLDEFWDEVAANLNCEGPIRFEIVKTEEVPSS